MQFIIVAVTRAVLAAFAWMVTGTALGRSLRACEQDLRMAALLGIDADRTISITFVIGAWTPPETSRLRGVIVIRSE